MAGLLMTAALPPFGWWPLAIVGAALLAVTADGLAVRPRLALGMATGLGLCVPGLFWMTEFSLPGYVLAAVLLSAVSGVPLALASRPWALPAAFVVADWLRNVWPFGGVPIALVGQTQIGGPLAQAGRLGGPLLVAALVGIAGTGVVCLARREWPAGAATAALAVAVVVGSIALPGLDSKGSITAALVQGGGPRGTRAVDTEDGIVFERHLAASADIPPGVDLVVWPEDVVDVEEDVEDTPEGDELAELADAANAVVVAGVITDSGTERFDNEAVAWDADGALVDRYRKNQRVPFGEYIPFRSLVESVADVSAVPRDATSGHGPAIVRAGGNDLAVVISFEVFFARRARSGVRAGGQVLLNPTNASSYTTGQMPALEVGAARLRAIETGQTVLQVSPTGPTAVIDPDGHVHQHTKLGSTEVVTTTVALRGGRTPYTRVGDLPMLLAAAATLALVHLGRQRRPGPRP